MYYYDEKSRYYETLSQRVEDYNAIYRIDDSGIAVKAWYLCPTLKANMGTYHHRVPIIRDDYGIRQLTPYECLALQGFPDDYHLPDIPIKEVYCSITPKSHVKNAGFSLPDYISKIAHNRCYERLFEI